MRFTSEQDTYNWALGFAKELKVGDKVALYGNLGAGKTVISRGICKGLGFEGTVCSPTYTILHEYPNNPPIFHFDLYRLEGGADLYEVGMDPDYLEAMVYHSRSENVDIVMNTSVEPEIGGISCSKPTLYPSRLVASFAIPTVWNRLYRRKFLIDNHLSFPEELSASEDYCFTKLAEALSEHTLVFPGPVYHHTLRVSSLSTLNTFDNIRASKLLYDEMRKRGIPTREFKLFYAGHMLLDSEERFNFARSFFMEIEPEVKENPDFYVPFDLFCLDSVLSCDTFDAFLEAYNPNLSLYFVKDRLGRK